MVVNRIFSRDDSLFDVYLKVNLVRDGDTWVGTGEFGHVEFDRAGRQIPCIFRSKDFMKIRIVSGQSLEVTTKEFAFNSDQVYAGWHCPFEETKKQAIQMWIPSSQGDISPSIYSEMRAEKMFEYASDKKQTWKTYPNIRDAFN